MDDLRRSNVLIVGAGGLGSHVAQFLRSARAADELEAGWTGAAPPTELTVVDFDRVEARNTRSQFHAQSTVGTNKAKALAQTMSFLWKTRLEAQTVKLTAANVGTVFSTFMGRQDYRLVIDCLDNAASRQLVQAEVRRFGLPCLHAALSGLGADIHDAYGRVVWDPRFVADPEDAAGAPTCQDGLALPFVALVAAWTAYSAQLWLSSRECADYAVGAFGARRL